LIGARHHLHSLDPSHISGSSLRNLKMKNTSSQSAHLTTSTMWFSLNSDFSLIFYRIYSAPVAWKQENLHIGRLSFFPGGNGRDCDYCGQICCLPWRRTWPVSTYADRQRLSCSVSFTKWQTSDAAKKSRNFLGDAHQQIRLIGTLCFTIVLNDSFN
jgi:hypothetical protein